LRRAEFLGWTVLICLPLMRSSRDKHPGTAYTVEISPTAWKQLATLPTDDYGRIRAKLDVLANELTAAQPPQWPTPEQEAPSVDARASIVEGFAVLYGVDTEHRRLTVLEVTKRLPQEE
jgi:mRNA-degrading endonuclease RelE of RelBE toxin-antitoxin system